MRATRLTLALVLLVAGFAACDGDSGIPPEPRAPVLRDGSGVIGSGEKSDSTTTTSSDSTKTGG